MTEIDQGPLDTRNQRATKRRKTDSAGTNSPRSRAKGISLNEDGTASPTSSTAPQTSASTSTLQQKKLLWLGALSHKELEDVVAGVKWHYGDPHNSECYICKRAGGLLGCRRCPRSYHAQCVGKVTDDPVIAENWDCPACALLGLDGMGDVSITAADVAQFKASKISETTPSPLVGSFREAPAHHSPSQQTENPYQARTPLKATKSSLDAKPSNYDTEKGKKRSRYSTLPSEVDEALAIINRELEAASYSKSIIAHTEARLHVAEQDLAIERGKAALAVSKVNQDEVFSLKEQAKQKDLRIEQLLRETVELRAEAEKHAAKVKELEDWKKLMMKMMIDGTSGS